MTSALDILKRYKNVAVVGATTTEGRPGNTAPKFLIDHGFNVIPVNPNETELFGRKAYPSLSDIPDPVDIVNVFRRSEAAPEIVDEAIKIGAKVVWMQEGVEHEEAAATARAAGLEVVMNLCIHCTVRDNEAELAANA